VAAVTDAYDAVFDRLHQELADATDLPVEFFRTAPTSGDWLRARAEVVEAHTQPHRDRAARLVGAMQDAVAQALELDRAGKLDWQTPILPRRCESEACDEYDGVHCYGDGCAMVRGVG
jgi:hypothetical protein